MVLTNEYVQTTMNEFFIWHVQNVIKCVNSVFIWLGSRRLKLFMLQQKFQRLKDKDYLIASLNFQAVKHAMAIVFVTIFHWKTNIATLKKFQHKSNFKSTFSLTECINYIYKIDPLWNTQIKYIFLVTCIHLNYKFNLCCISENIL